MKKVYIIPSTSVVKNSFFNSSIIATSGNTALTGNAFFVVDGDDEVDPGDGHDGGIGAVIGGGGSDAKRRNRFYE